MKKRLTRPIAAPLWAWLVIDVALLMGLVIQRNWFGLAMGTGFVLALIVLKLWDRWAKRRHEGVGEGRADTR